MIKYRELGLQLAFGDIFRRHKEIQGKFGEGRNGGRFPYGEETPEKLQTLL